MRFLLRILAHSYAVFLLAVPSIASAQSTCAQFGVIALDGGAYNFQMNEFNSSSQECATTSGIGFNITTANFTNAANGAPGAYSSLYRGCHWGTCTSSNPFPIQESNIASASTSVALTQPSGYNNDSAYDIWFNQTSTTSGQPNGTEIMIWLNHQGSVQPFGSQTGTATIDNAQYEVWTGNQSSWKIVSYVAATPVHSVSHLNLLPFFEDAVTRGSLEPSWWLIDIEFGFEIWTGRKRPCCFQLLGQRRSRAPAAPAASSLRAQRAQRSGRFLQRHQSELDRGYRSGQLHDCRL